MAVSSPAIEMVTAKHVRVTREALIVELHESRTVPVPVA